MTRKQLIVILLCTVVIFASALVHMAHPAYAKYAEVERLLERRQTEFERRIEQTLIPELSRLVDAVGKSSPSPDSQVVRSDPLTVERPPDITTDYRFSLAGTSLTGVLAVARIDGWDYMLGDPYLGSQIVHISPSCAILSDGRKILPFRSARSDTMDKKEKGVPGV